jgi:cytochrome c peroxidase
MFSDFREHVLGVPQIAASLTNAAFDGPGFNEDFGLEQITGDPADRYKFRTSPLRNVSVQPTFFHNGAFTHLDDAIRHHLNVIDSADHYTPTSQNLPADLSGLLGPIAPVLDRLDPILSTPVVLSELEFEQLLVFVRDSLLDPRATPDRLRHLVPRSVPSGRPVLVFEFP